MDDLFYVLFGLIILIFIIGLCYSYLDYRKNKEWLKKTIKEKSKKNKKGKKRK